MINTLDSDDFWLIENYIDAKFLELYAFCKGKISLGHTEYLVIWLFPLSTKKTNTLVVYVCFY